MLKILTLQIVALISQVWAADEAHNLPPAIQSIVEKAEAEVSKNRKVYDLANSKTLDATEKSLRVELEKMTKAGKLEEATAAKKMLESVRADVVAKVDGQARDNGGLLGNESLNPKIKILSMPEFDILKVSATSIKGKATATSEFSGSFLATNAIDGNLQSQWALRGPKGSLLVSVDPPKDARTIYFVSRSSGDDLVADGTITINKSIIIPVKDFQTESVLVVTLPEMVKISSLEYLVKSGNNNPGLKEVILGK